MNNLEDRNLSKPIVSKKILSGRILKLIKRVLRSLLALLEMMSLLPAVLNRRKKIDYLFFPSNDTHVKWMIPIYDLMPRAEFLVKGYTNDENSALYLKEHKYKFIKNKRGFVKLLAPNVLIVGNDWGREEKMAIDEIRLSGGVSVCIQEGCLDFFDEEYNRMQYSDYAFIQGPIMEKYLIRDRIVVTGNPKYDDLRKESLPNKPTIMINSNFTYRIYEDVRDQWVKDIVDICQENNIDFFISKHPRDEGTFPNEYNVVESGAFLVNDQLRQSTILVSRFSTLIYEALCMGRKVIYYNPHKEPFRIFSEDDTKGIFIAKDKSVLKEGILEAIVNSHQNEENVKQFLKLHCNLGEENIRAAERIRDELKRINQKITKIE